MADWLTERFEENRSHLRGVAYRMLGSLDDADDAVQEAWLRLSRRENDDIENAGGWLTTVVARICVDMLRARRSKREESLDLSIPDFIVSREEGPEDEVLTADSVGLALLVVLDSLTPTERLAFVLHDMFALPFEEIAPIVGRSLHRRSRSPQGSFNALSRSSSTDRLESFRGFPTASRYRS